MNPYKTANQIRSVENTLNTFTYEAFDKVAPEVRVSLNTVLDVLRDLANQIEREADKEFANDSGN